MLLRRMGLTSRKRWRWEARRIPSEAGGGEKDPEGARRCDSGEKMLQVGNIQISMLPQTFKMRRWKRLSNV